MERLRIRQVRTGLDMSLRTLATAANLSPGLVSQVERGLTEPSLDTLRRIARALGVPLFSLFEDERPAAKVVRSDRRMVVRSPHSGVEYTRISPGTGNLEMLEGVLAPGGRSADQPWSHPSEECVLVVEGTMVIHAGGERHELSEGDSCYFDSRVPHLYENETDRPARFLLSVTPPSF